MSILSVENINISVKDRVLLNNSHLQIDEGDVILLCGKNGSGKSTVIRTIMNDLPNGSQLFASADIIFNDSKIATEKDREFFNQNVCYIAQDDIFETNRVIDCCLTSISTIDSIENKIKYIFDFALKNGIYAVCFSNDEDVNLTVGNFLAKKILKSSGISHKEATQEQLKTALFLSKNPTRLSGGQRKMVNIFSNLVRYEYSSLCVIDEPLNALDFDNVRLFSNFLTTIHREKKSLGILIVTHCRSIPCITKMLKITEGEIVEITGERSCFSCFGNVNEYGYYE